VHYESLVKSFTNPSELVAVSSSGSLVDGARPRDELRGGLATTSDRGSLH
jgi:hypothetical protein